MVLPPAPPRVVCLGNVVADHVFRVEDIPQPPAKIAARSYVLNAGGMAANAAIAVTRLGGRADFWGRVGDDLNAPLLAAALEADGVNTTGLKRMAGGRSPVSAVLVDRHGERTIIGFRGADLGTDPDWLPLQTLASAGALCCDPRWPEGVAAAAAEARRLCIPVVLDGEKSETRILVDLVPRVDHAIFSVTGLQNFAPGCAPEEGLWRAIALNPARRLGLGCGRLAVDAPADLVLFDPDAPLVLDRFSLRSKSKNTPFDGARLQGKVLATYVAGTPVYEREAA
mgnify:CR=1 FL=1